MKENGFGVNEHTGAKSAQKCSFRDKSYLLNAWKIAYLKDHLESDTKCR